MSTSKVQQVLVAHPAITLAYVFGSVAGGRARPDSDVDVAVQASQPPDLAMRMQLVEGLALATGHPVDLIDLPAADEPLLGQVLKPGERISARRARMRN